MQFVVKYGGGCLKITYNTSCYPIIYCKKYASVYGPLAGMFHKYTQCHCSTIYIQKAIKKYHIYQDIGGLNLPISHIRQNIWKFFS